MTWDLLLLDERRRKSSATKHKTDGRNVFDNDYTRMIMSSHVRRLQNKTQVFPLDDNDFVRTRLTHSMEVSNFARSLGQNVEMALIEAGKLDERHKGEIPSILMTAGLLHDIGNPAFGHFGENCIREYVGKYISKKKFR